MNVDFPEESDSSDEDYVPTGPGTAGEVPSEVESDGDSEDPLSESEDPSKKGAKRRKRSNKTKKKSKTESLGNNSVAGSSESSPVKQLTDADKKKHADSLWASFKKDTGFKKKPQDEEEPVREVKDKEIKKPIEKLVQKVPEKVKVTQIFEFAGEEVKIEKEVPRDSAEARLLTEPSGSAEPAKSKGRSGGLGGIGSVLNQIGKKQKLSTLEKTKLDWNRFKKTEQIEEELETYKKGKDGYLERQDFLERADHRRFEIEKEIRTIERNKRMNNVQ